MNYMKRFAGLVCAVAAVVFFASCSKDKESGTIAFDSPAVFLNAGDAVTVGFSASNIESFSITGKPTGWSDPVIDAANRTITVVSPEKFDDDNDAVKSGSVTLTGKVHGGSTASATLFVGVVDTEDLSRKSANSYLINKKETNYLIDAMYKGDVTEQVPSSVDVVWQSRSNLIQYLELKDGKASFYVAADSDDGDKIKEGNAVIGAYDAGGTLIWSWHVWAADYDPDAEGGAVDFNGYSMMTRNLGALAADNSSVENILASYGLYYQWGRKDPFIGPRLPADGRFECRDGYGGLRRAAPADLHHGRLRFGERLAVERTFRRFVVRFEKERLRSLSLWLAGGSVGRVRRFETCGSPHGGGCRQIRLGPDRSGAGNLVAVYRRWTPPLRQQHDPERLQPRHRAQRGRGGAALGGPLLDRRDAVGYEIPGFPLLVREEDHRRRPRKQRPLCPCQRHVGALREGAIGTSGRNRTTDRP